MNRERDSGYTFKGIPANVLDIKRDFRLDHPTLSSVSCHRDAKTKEWFLVATFADLAEVKRLREAEPIYKGLAMEYEQGGYARALDKSAQL